MAKTGCEHQRSTVTRSYIFLVDACLEQYLEAVDVPFNGYHHQRSKAIRILSLKICVARECVPDCALLAVRCGTHEDLVCAALLDERIEGPAKILSRGIAILSRLAHGSSVDTERLCGEQQRVARALCKRGS